MSIASPIEQAMLDLINQERSSAGVAPLQLNNLLNDAAEDHSENMLVNNIFSHTGFDGSTARERMVDAGYVFSGTNASGENIAYQSERGAEGIDDDMRDLHDGLMNSPGHRANILNPSFKEIGIGIEEGLFTDGGATFSAVMVTQNFALTQTATIPDNSVPFIPFDSPTELPEMSQTDETPVAPPQTPTTEASETVTPTASDTTPQDVEDAQDLTPQTTTDVVTDAEESEDTLAPVEVVEVIEVVELPDTDVEVDLPITPVSDVTPEEDVTLVEDVTPVQSVPVADDTISEEDIALPEDVDIAPTPEEDDMAPTPEDVDITPTPEEADITPTPQEDDMAPTPEDGDTTQTPEDGDDFEFTEVTDDGGDAEADAGTPVWVKTHDDDTYAKVIADFTADCNAEDFAALDTELQLFVIREFDCDFEIA